MMAAMISFTCPECKTQLKGPADMQGKKARCKHCAHVFVLKANAPTAPASTAPANRGKAAQPAKAPARTAPGKPATKKPAEPEPETEAMTYTFQDANTEVVADNAKPPPPPTPPGQKLYGVTDLDLTPRCPFCAQELESEDAIICLHCGYNNRTRSHPTVQRTYANTGGEVFLWLLPGIGCVVGILALIGLICYLWMQLDPKDYEKVWYGDFIKPAQIWGSIFSAGAIVLLGRFAIKRLIFHPTPPEKEKK